MYPMYSIFVMQACLILLLLYLPTRHGKVQVLCSIFSSSNPIKREITLNIALHTIIIVLVVDSEEYKVASLLSCLLSSSTSRLQLSLERREIKCEQNA